MFLNSQGYKWGVLFGLPAQPRELCLQEATQSLSAWLQCLDHSSYWNNMHKLLKQLFSQWQFHLWSSPSVSNYLCITRGLCHSSSFEGGSCHVISLGMLYTSVSRDRMLSLLTDAFVSLQTATQKWSICGREHLSILYFNYFLPAFLMPGRGFSPRWCTNSVCISSKTKFPSQSARAKGNKKWHDLITLLQLFSNERRRDMKAKLIK